MVSLTTNPIQGAVDLLGFPAEEAKRLHEERIARCADPNAKMAIPTEWDNLKRNADMFKKELMDRAIPNQLPEHLFKKFFLPVFAALHAGDPSWDNFLKDSPVLHDWGKIAGMPYRPVDIINDSKTKILFTVPPMFHRMRSFINTDPNTCFLSLVDQTRRHNGRSPHFAERYFTENLQYFAPGADKNRLAADTLQWLYIFDRYEVPLYSHDTQEYKTIKEMGLADLLKGAGTGNLNTSTDVLPSTKNCNGNTNTVVGIGDTEDF